MSCQVCKEPTPINISMCRKCYKFIKVKSWNDWIKNTKKNKPVKKVKFNNTVNFDYTRSIKEEIDLLINQEVMCSIQEIISNIMEEKNKLKMKMEKKKKQRKRLCDLI